MADSSVREEVSAGETDSRLHQKSKKVARLVLQFYVCLLGKPMFFLKSL